MQQWHGTTANETRERRIEGPPLPSSPHGEASYKLASLGYNPSRPTSHFKSYLYGFSMSHLFDEGQIFHDLGLNV
jgi:hypothetical protein